MYDKWKTIYVVIGFETYFSVVAATKSHIYGKFLPFYLIGSQKTLPEWSLRVIATPLPDSHTLRNGSPKMGGLLQKRQRTYSMLHTINYFARSQFYIMLHVTK